VGEGVEVFGVLFGDQRFHGADAGVAHVAEVVDFADAGGDGGPGVFAREAAAAVHDERHATDALELGDAVEVKLGLGLVEAVYRAHAGRQRVDAGVGDKARGLGRVGVDVLAIVVGILQALVAGGEADLGLDVRPVVVRELHGGAGERYVLVVGQ